MNKGFKGCHPMVNILFFIAVVVFGMLLQHPVSLAVSLIASLAYNIKLKGSKEIRKLVYFLLPILVFVVVINGIFSHYGVTNLFTLPFGNNVTLESLIYGLILGVEIITVIEWFSCYNEVVTTDKFMHIFGKHLPKTALVISMALRFVPMYKNRLHIIADAQRGLGLDYKTGNIISRIKNGTKIISMLITWALENAIETSDSMRSRGYGQKRRKSYSKFEWTPNDIFLLILMAVMIIIVAVASFSGEFDCSYNPVIEIGKMTWSSYAAIIVYSFLCFLPIIIDLKEDIKWNSIKSKI